MTLQETAAALIAEAKKNQGILKLDNAIIQTPSWQTVLDVMKPQTVTLTVANPDSDIYVEADVLHVKGSGTLYQTTVTAEVRLIGQDVAKRESKLDAVLASVQLQDIPKESMGLINNPKLYLPPFSFKNVPLSVTADGAGKNKLKLGIDSSDQSFDILPMLKLSLSKLGFEVTKSYDSFFKIYYYTLSLSGTFVIGSATMPAIVGIPASVGAVQTWSFQLGKEGDYAIQLSDLFNVLAGTNASSQIPPALTTVGGFGIVSISVAFTFSATGAKVSSTGLTIGCDDWTVVEGFKVQKARFSINVSDPFGTARSVIVMILGDFVLGQDPEYLFSLTMTLPFGGQDWVMNLTASIPLDNISAFKALPGGLNVDSLNLPSNVAAASLEVYQFQVSYNPTSNTIANFSLYVQLKAAWYFYKDVLGIANPYLRLSIKNPINPNRVINLAAGGTVILDDVYLQVDTTYSNTPRTWSFKVSLASGSQIELKAIVKKLLPDYNLADWPSFIPNLIISQLEIYVFSDPATGKSNYRFKGETVANWDINWGELTGISAIASFDVAYDSGKTEGAPGILSGTLTLKWIISQLEVSIGYQFDNTQKCLFVIWKYFKGSYCATTNGNFIKIEIGDISLGKIVEMLVLVVQPSLTTYSLPSPWNVLNEISLKGLTLKVDLTTYKVEVLYNLPKPIDLWFIKLEGLSLSKPDPVAGSSSWLDIAITGSYLGGQPIPAWKAPDQSPPPVPGEGTTYFDLFLLALGQHVSIYGYENFKSIDEVIKAMQKIPPTSGGSNPVTAQQVKGQPYFNNESNWLVASNFGIMKVGNDWTIDLSIVFNDPNLYGLRIAMAGEKAKIFKGLVFEIMYKKISDSVGMYQMLLTLPDILRYLRFGVVNITLPLIGIQIYTNGDFLIDIGFPYNQDFSRSFTAQAIISGIPFKGSAGFYFGKLSSETATQVPVTTKGIFNPVIVFGLGIQFGLGYDLRLGILEAGFSITIFGIIEGVLATWNPYQLTAQDELALASPSDVEGTYYYKVTGTIGIIGYMYAIVDFGIIKADVNITIKAFVRGTFEAYREMLLAMEISVTARASIKINLGLFSITIKFSFAIKITQEYSFGSRKLAPWDGSSTTKNLTVGQEALVFPSDGSRNRMRRPEPMRRPQRQSLLRHSLRKHLKAQRKASPHALRAFLSDRVPLGWSMMAASIAQSLEKSFNWTPYKVSTQDGLTGYFMSGLTVAGPQTGPANAQTAEFVATLYLDAPDPSAPPTGATSFDRLVRNTFLWVVNSWMSPNPGDLTREQVLALAVSVRDLQDAYDALSDTDNPSPISYANIKTFLKDIFKPNVIAPGKDAQLHGALFAIIPEFSLKVPAYNGNPEITRDFYTYSQCGEKYQAFLRTYFNQLEVQVKEEQGGGVMATDAPQETIESLATFMFEDYFLLLARQSLQDAVDAMNAYTYPLAAGDSLQSILDWMNKVPGNKTTVSELIAKAVAHPLNATNPSAPLWVAGLQHEIAAAQSLRAIGYAIGIDLTTLGNLNAANPDILQPGAEIVYGGRSFTVAAGDTLQDAATYFAVPVATLVTAPEVADLPTLLLEGAWMILAGTNYQVQSGDTIAKAAAVYGVNATDWVLQNQVVAGLLRPGTVVKFGTRSEPVKSTDNFKTLAVALDTTIDLLAADPTMHNQPDLLVALTLTMVPPFRHAPQAGDSLQSIANRYSLTPETLANNFVNVQITDIFDRGQDNEKLELPPLEYLELSRIADQMLAVGNFTSLAGMTSRYALHGLRLPVNSDITFPKGPPCGADSTCAVYKMTGQQWSLPKTFSGDYIFYIEKPASLDWIQFNGAVGNSLKVTADTTSAIPLIQDVLNYAVTNGVQPKVVSLDIMAFSSNDAATYNFKSQMQWQAATPPVLPYGTAGSQANPVLNIWNFPSSLQSVLELQKKLAPAYSVQIGRSQNGNSSMEIRNAGYYGWATMVPVQIKKLANTGSEEAATLYNYELLGTAEESIGYLEYLLTYLRPTNDFVDQIQILFPPNATTDTPEGVQSDGLQNIVSFITQSNLSTDTRPPGLTTSTSTTTTAAEVERTVPRGILNETYDFVRLLWQASITRNGGYSLYYENVTAGTGFKDSIFNEDDIATLYVLVIYEKPAQVAAYNLLYSYTNCVVTGDQIDTQSEVVYAEAMPQLATYSTVSKDSLETIAAQYYSSPIDVAQENPTVALRVDANQPLLIRISGAKYEVRPPQSAPGNNLQSVLTYFGITKAQLEAANPGVPLPDTLQIWLLLNIPDIDYTVADGKPQGKTLEAIAKYYFVSIANLAVSNSSKSDIFPIGTALKINNQLRNKSQLNPQGNVGFEMVVENPGTPQAAFDSQTLAYDAVGAASTDYANAYLRDLYTLLSYQVVANTGFKTSIMGLPVGPLDNEEDKDLENPPFQYRKVIPVSRYAVYNNIPDQADLPPAADNPYAGIGGYAQFHLDWNDLYGNLTRTPLSDPSMNPSAPLNNLPAQVGYTDQLIGIGGWPSVTTDYLFDKGLDGKPRLYLNFYFDCKKYEIETPATQDRLESTGKTQGQVNAEDDLKVVTSIYYQLNQIYPSGGSKKYMLEAAMFNTLVKQEYTLLDDSQFEKILTFVNQIYKYLVLAAKGTTPCAVPKFALEAIIDPNTDLKAGDLIALKAGLQFTRPIAYVNTEFREQASVVQTLTMFNPMAQPVATESTGDPTQTLEYFAAYFEGAFLSPGNYVLKVAATTRLSGNASAADQKNIWVVRMGLQASQSIWYQIGGKPYFYAPRPLANALQARQGIAIYPYIPGIGIDYARPQHKDFTGVDMDAWGRQALQAIDDFLAPAYAAGAFIVDELSDGDFLAQIVQAKETLARAISQDIAGVLADSDSDLNRLDDARERFRQELLTSLGIAYTVTALVQYDVQVKADYADAVDKDTPPRLFGNPIATRVLRSTENEGEEGSAKENNEFSFSSSKIALPQGDAANAAYLSFFFTTRNPEASSSIIFDIDWKAGFLENGIQSVEEIKGYEASTWLSFVLPDDTQDGLYQSPLTKQLGEVEIPVLLRAYPTPPSLNAQTFSASDDSATTLGDASAWNYEIVYVTDHAAQDRIDAEVRFNLKAGEKFSDARFLDLFEALAEFNHVYPAIQKDFIQYLAKLNGKTTVSEEAYTVSLAAVRSFAELCTEIAAAWEDWRLVRDGIRDDLDNEKSSDYLFNIKEKPVSRENDTLLIEIDFPSQETLLHYGRVSSSRLPGLLNASFEVPLVNIADFVREAGPVPNSYIYKYPAPSDQYLTFATAQGIAEREVVLPDLNILNYQNAWSGVAITRNESLMTDPAIATNPAFIYTTPLVKFANKLIPLLDQNTVIDIAKIPTGVTQKRKLPDQLIAFLSALLTPSLQAAQTLKMEVSYFYRIQDNEQLPAVQVPVLLLPPTDLPIPGAWEPVGGTCPTGYDANAAFVCNLAYAITEWFSRTNPSKTRAYFSFDVAVFSNLNETKLPLLRLRNVTLKQADIVW